MNKKILGVCVVVAIIVVVVLTWGRFYRGNDANRVLKVPTGFVRLEPYLKNGLSMMPFETQIAFLDADRIAIFQTGFQNHEFIVKYKGVYYVNEEKIIEIADVAAMSPEQRRKVYQFGDKVDIRGDGETRYTVEINDLETGAKKIDGTDALITYRIKYTLTSNTPGGEETRLISLVETAQGVKYNDFNFIDAETVSIQIRAREKDQIKTIILASPEYPGLTYKIAVPDAL